MKSDAQISTEAFLYRSIVNHEQVSLESVAPVEAWWTFFQDVPEDEVSKTRVGAEMRL